MSKNQFTGTATQPQRNRKFCQFNKDQYCINDEVFTLLSHCLCPGDYDQNLFIYTVEGVMCLCGGRKKTYITSFLVQLSILSGLYGPFNVIRCIRKLKSRC